MENRNLKITGYIAFISTSFIISTIFTILLMTSTVSSKLEYNLVVGMAIILQLSTTLFVAKAMLDNKIHMTIRIIMVCISVALFLASVIANVGLIQNNANKTRNNERRASSGYQQAERTNNRQQQLHNAKLEEIKNTTASFDLVIEQTKDTLQKSNAAWERNKHTDLLNKSVQDKTKRLAELNQELNNITISPISTDNIVIDSESGYDSTFHFLSETRIIKAIFQNATSDQLQNYFFIMLSSIFEFINMIALYLLSVFLQINIKKISAPDPAPKQKIPTPEPKLEPKLTPKFAPKFAPKLNLVKSKRALSLEGFKDSKLKDNNKLSDSDIKKYLTYVNAYCKEKNTDIVPGYQNVSKHLKLDTGKPMGETRVRKIVAWLQQEGVLKLVNGRYEIIKKNMEGVG